MIKILVGLLAALLLSIFRAPALEQSTVTCDRDYTLTAGDWLSKIADKYYGNPKVYGVIAMQTNLKSQTDFSYATIVNPDVVQVGYKLCLPTAGTANALNGNNAPHGLTETDLANAAYTSPLFSSTGVAQLQDGKFVERDASDGTLLGQVALTGQYAWGDLNGIPSAAVVSVSSGGGSGSFYELHILQMQDGKPTDIAMTLLGDRSPVLAVWIADNQIGVDEITQGPGEGLCCGTLRVVSGFTLNDRELKLANEKALGNLGPHGETPGADTDSNSSDDRFANGGTMRFAE